MSDVEVTLTFRYEPERENYRMTYDAEGNNAYRRTDEELEALTVQQMADEDKEALAKGDFSLLEILDWSDFPWDTEGMKKHITFKAV